MQKNAALKSSMEKVQEELKSDLLKEEAKPKWKENKMGTERIASLMLSMGIPMILSMILQACYNIVDSMFVGRMDDGERALTALTVAFPVQMLIVAFSIGTGVGVNGYLKTQTKNPVVFGYAKTYLKICCILSFGIVMFSIFEKLLQSTGKTVLSTTAQILGAATNIILDPIMIFGYLGCPKLGIH